MKESKFNFATVIALIVLMVFAYFTFMGLVYLKAGSVIVAALLAVLLVVLVMAAVQIMCVAKATRWQKIGLAGQLICGAVIFVLLMLASLPLTSFLNVVGNQKELKSNVVTACDMAIDIDSAYVRYVNKRVDDYKQNLELISRGKAQKPSLYNEALGGATGDSDEKKIENLTTSLRSSLMPDTITNVVRERQAWVEKAKSVVVWNPLTAANLAKVDEQVSGWTENYAQLSTITYKGEETEPFKYEQFDSQISAITNTYTKLQAPSIVAVLLSLLCFAVMLLPYLVTQKSLAGSSSGRSVLYE